MNSNELSALWGEVSTLLTEEHFNERLGAYVSVPDMHYAGVQRLFDRLIADAVLQEMREHSQRHAPQDAPPEGAAPARLGAPGKELRNCS